MQQERQYTHIVTLRHVRLTVVVLKNKIITYPECVSVALVTCDLSLPLSYFSTLSHKQHDFRGGKCYRT